MDRRTDRQLNRPFHCSFVIVSFSSDRGDDDDENEDEEGDSDEGKLQDLFFLFLVCTYA